MSLTSRECQRFVEEVTEVMERAAPPDVLTWFESHLDQCHRCAEYLEQMHETTRLLATTLESIPADHAPELRALLEQVRQSGRGTD